MKTKPGYLSTASFKKEHKRLSSLVPYILLSIIALVVSIVIVSDLHWEEHVSINRGFVIFFSGLVFFPSLYLALVNTILYTNSGRRIIKTYKLNYSDVYDISNKHVSAVQALFCCITGITAICYSCNRNVLRTSHYISEAYAWFGAAYFFYDIWSMYKVYSAKLSSDHMNGDVKEKKKMFLNVSKWIRYLKNNFVIVGHHIFIGCFGFLVITYLRGGLGDCFFGFVYLMEASTPFVSLRGVLSKIGMKNSPMYVINGLVMLAVFFICRIAMFPYVIYMYAESIKVDFMSAVYTLPRGCIISIMVLLLPQLYWFYLMVTGATKVLRRPVVNNNNTKNLKGK
ncbi:TLC domain-containing protein 3A [Diabrotica virgifera virgifera]|uniref:TLC domain-containing protein n=1 Tax=Diabrotica virgifera virgifera TaxID=50390 RepID=A0ABM5JNE5_DIAVI|nr:TLC domain-containing protein 3A [Diabrotica virgifera virgifera]